MKKQKRSNNSKHRSHTMNNRNQRKTPPPTERGSENRPSSLNLIDRYFQQSSKNFHCSSWVVHTPMYPNRMFFCCISGFLLCLPHASLNTRQDRSFSPEVRQPEVDQWCMWMSYSLYWQLDWNEYSAGDLTSFYPVCSSWFASGALYGYQISSPNSIALVT